MIKAIETEHNGYQFRSQLEARWALFFDMLGIPYIYELDGYKLDNGNIWYRPDFWLPKHDRYIEIKPFSPSKIELDKAFNLAVESQRDVFILCGDPYGLMEVHFFGFMSRETLDFMLHDTMIESYFNKHVELISEDGCIVHHIGKSLEYYIGVNIYSQADDRVEYHFDFAIEWKDHPNPLDMDPDFSAKAIDLALAARKHQFWRPRASS